MSFWWCVRSRKATSKMDIWLANALRRAATKGHPFLVLFSPPCPPSRFLSRPWRSKTTHRGRVWSMQSLSLPCTLTRDVVVRGGKWGRDVLWLGQSGGKCKCVWWNMPEDVAPLARRRSEPTLWPQVRKQLEVLVPLALTAAFSSVSVSYPHPASPFSPGMNKATVIPSDRYSLPACICKRAPPCLFVSTLARALGPLPLRCLSVFVCSTCRLGPRGSAAIWVMWGNDSCLLALRHLYAHRRLPTQHVCLPFVMALPLGNSLRGGGEMRGKKALAVLKEEDTD